MNGQILSVASQTRSVCRPHQWHLTELDFSSVGMTEPRTKAKLITGVPSSNNSTDFTTYLQKTQKNGQAVQRHSVQKTHSSCHCWEGVHNNDKKNVSQVVPKL